ncbi:DUF4150 domain-containing protein [uncultured Tateyamaria sp.]|uniref:DUF4150 domain-containing protein n=1 Tax=uncultured Tateyamaria sp. TaxID=455651 RepID=UPI0026253832|nr:DUF4150 domain-containing protein [uncultured Tateyamaria sp.]
MTVFANNLEISAKAQGCKIIAAFPDTCFTPPQTPATPPGVPIPYPNFAMDSDLTKGSSKVLIGGKEVSMENASKWSKVSGDEAGCAPKKGIITSKNTGAAYAKKWSMDVKVESKGVVRFTDMATTNHASDPGDDAPWIVAGIPGPPVVFESANCLVGSYDGTKDACNERGGQAHHIIPDQYVRQGNRGTPPSDPAFPSEGEGCSICVGGNAYGSAACEANPRSARGIANRDSTVESGRSYAAATGTTSLATLRGHGFLHQFDERFREMSPPSVANALKTANDLLDECVAYDQSAVDSECAEKAKECIAQQYSTAKKQNKNLKKFKPRSQASKDKRQSRLFG